MNKSMLKFAFTSAMAVIGFGFLSQTVYAEQIEPEEIVDQVITDESEEVIEIEEGDTTEALLANPSDTNLNIEAHVADVGWMPEVHEEDLVGTTGQAHALEAVTINIDSIYEGDIHYQAHVSNISWQAPVQNGAMSGTEGQALSVEAIRIWLTGEVSEKYDIYYQSHVANIGWLGWAHNGASAGSQGYGYAMEALRIQLVAKGKEAPVGMTNPFAVEQLQMEAHVANVGWMDPVTERTIVGTVGQANAIEAVSIQLANPVYDGNIVYRVYVEGDGWLTNEANGIRTGTVGESKHIEAIEVLLEGEIANHYDIYYQTHVAHLGWLGWAKNGEKAGSIGYDYGIEAISFKLLEKGLPAPSTTTKAPFDERILSYDSHVSYVGWTEPSGNSQPSGNFYNSIEAIQMFLNKNLYPTSHIQYRSHIENVGWENTWKQDGQMSGTEGQALALEAIQMKLSGDISKEYNLFYRTYSLGYGWLDWASNGNSAGTEGLAKSILGIQISLVPVAKQAPETGSDVSFITNKKAERNGTPVTGNVHVNSGATTIFIYDYAGIVMEGIDISSHNGYIDLSHYKDQFVIIRVSYGTYLDPFAKRNMDLCEQLGIPYGVYCYSYALDNEGALSEAEFLLEQIKGRNIQVGVWFDMEDADNYKAVRAALTPENCSSFCRTFCAKVREAGYYTGIYSSSSWFGTYIRGCDEYEKWVANWGINDGNLGYQTYHLGPLQQYTSIPLDKNVMYVPLNHFKV